MDVRTKPKRAGLRQCAASAIELTNAFLLEVGCAPGDIVVTSCQEGDIQEDDIKSLVNEVGRQRSARGGGRRVVKRSTMVSSASNCTEERASQPVQGQVRVTELASEARCHMCVCVCYVGHSPKECCEALHWNTAHQGDLCAITH